MVYSTLTDIQRLITERTVIQLTDDENLGTVNLARVAGAIDQADAEIDSYCGGRFRVPFVIVPDIVKKMSVDIAIYNLYSRRVEEMPEVRTDRYKNAIRQLEGISKGLISIGEAVSPPGTTSEGGVTTNKTISTRIFTRGNLSGL